MTPRTDIPAPGDARSFWLQEALAYDPGAPCPPLEAKLSVDVCVVGGGFAGLWATEELLSREPGLRVAVLESDICGGGASGRNGGAVSASWHDLPALCGIYGVEPGLRYAQALSDEVDETGRWCEEHGVDAWFHRDGILAVTADQWQEGIDDAIELADRLGVGERLRWLGVEDVRTFVRSPRFRGGSFTADGAIVQPARLARGLRRVALERGARIFERSAVTRIEHGSRPIVRTEHGAVRAEHVVLTIGTWAAGWRGFRRAFAGTADFMVVTEPIPERLAEIGWNSWVCVIDGRELLYYLRKTEDERIAIGGGASGVLFGGHVGRRATHDRRVAERAAQGLSWLFPQLEGVRFTHAWGGPIDMTATWTPFFQTVGAGNVHAGLGFSGHGLAAAKLGGRILASLVLRAADAWSSLPVVGPPVASVPPEPLRFPAVLAIAHALGSGDRRQERGAPRGAIREAVGNVPATHRGRIAARRGAGPAG